MCDRRIKGNVLRVHGEVKIKNNWQYFFNKFKFKTNKSGLIIQNKNYALVLGTFTNRTPLLSYCVWGALTAHTL